MWKINTGYFFIAAKRRVRERELVHQSTTDIALTCALLYMQGATYLYASPESVKHLIYRHSLRSPARCACTCAADIYHTPARYIERARSVRRSTLTRRDARVYAASSAGRRSRASLSTSPYGQILIPSLVVGSAP